MIRVPRALAAAALALLLGAGTVSAALIWGNATVNVTVQRQIEQLINAEHLRVCGKYLSHSSQLRTIARWKATSMGIRDRMSHYTVDGRRTFDFYAQAGIPKTYGAGEIIAVNNYPDDQTARVAFNGWMGSTSHRAAIRNCDYDRFGVGTFKTAGKSNKWYAVEFTNVRR